MSIWNKIKSLVIIGLGSYFGVTTEEVKGELLSFKLEHDETDKSKPYSVTVIFTTPFRRNTDDFRFLLIT